MFKIVSVDLSLHGYAYRWRVRTKVCPKRSSVKRYYKYSDRFHWIESWTFLFSFWLSRRTTFQILESYKNKNSSLADFLNNKISNECLVFVNSSLALETYFFLYTKCAHGFACVCIYNKLGCLSFYYTLWFTVPKLYNPMAKNVLILILSLNTSQRNDKEKFNKCNPLENLKCGYLEWT